MSKNAENLSMISGILTSLLHYTAFFSFVTQQDEEDEDEEEHCIRILKTAV